ncbi:vacuolar protein sorting-associated protein 2, putative [Plasmodium berghei]|uniref:Vacuolar protein sorting-associated protein 2, putative n=2 Tax=Plasmodium berghei TaxID=5821 RepID=A0A509AIP8_PLABA|nr:vacuolar protein sorting-associated protein 2, putative [Plasmodium berghei ANKA]CXI25692.1 vacuolar protein sorting-associated protein 2, putative [Plasmodium berghei]SCM20421.1 vacuolar protein sorting-associated protein 2, putative [Plasmodium berghei]SCN24014.1 vacuolar protein sorting-associated protein 2, putative [Plasmodium berghei]SCO59354.1 vacuolar protein sorting-associated protein 2, putative [Plasmodium berghei]SCO60471.1 vacuolar protein sorting-associated protein 2, putative|eukprot:XP_034420891.1 vacuolar protein sorting-associated protein 2, putative [Plasmodium berghei ANKA]
MGGYFSKNLEECLREEKRNLNRSIRELEREIFKLENEKKQIEKNIKLYAKKNDITLVRTLAKDFVKVKQTVTKYSKIKSHLFSMKIKLQSVKSSEQLSKSLNDINKIITRVNKYIKLKNINKSIYDFQKQNDEVSLKEDMLDDLFDTLNYDIDMAEEEDIIVSKVLDGLGIQMNSKLDEIPSVSELKTEQVETKANVADFQERINNLKK